MFARFRDCEDDSTAGPEGVGDDSREAAKVRASHLSIRPFCHCLIPQKGYMRSVCLASGSGGGEIPCSCSLAVHAGVTNLLELLSVDDVIVD